MGSRGSSQQHVMSSIYAGKWGAFLVCPRLIYRVCPRLAGILIYLAKLPDKTLLFQKEQIVNTSIQGFSKKQFRTANKVQRSCVEEFNPGCRWD